eukprot:5702939-Prymnesium_polylepis.1
MEQLIFNVRKDQLAPGNASRPVLLRMQGSDMRADMRAHWAVVRAIPSMTKLRVCSLMPKHCCHFQ